MTGIRPTFFLHAPSIHTGGGFVLLQALLATWPNAFQLTALLDTRVRGHIMLPDGALITWVDASVGSRLKAEIYLSSAAKTADIIFCFHGLPPLLSNQAKNIVFLQNRLYIEPNLPKGYRLKTYLRIVFERFVSRVFRYRVSEYIVQTPSMQLALSRWYGASALVQVPVVRVLSFLDVMSFSSKSRGVMSEWDFVYVADGEAHKNHRVLLAAWQLLAEDGLYPSLALTLSSRDSALKHKLKDLPVEAGFRIKDLGHMSHENVLALYSTAKALIFPSTCESFGLPLIEAMHIGLPILASELDFVRDVCSPVQTFDPTSALSIARAVKRFLAAPEPVLQLRSSQEFWLELLGPKSK